MWREELILVRNISFHSGSFLFLNFSLPFPFLLSFSSNFLSFFSFNHFRYLVSFSRLYSFAFSFFLSSLSSFIISYSFPFPFSFFSLFFLSSFLPSFLFLPFPPLSLHKVLLPQDPMVSQHSRHMLHLRRARMTGEAFTSSHQGIKGVLLHHLETWITNHILRKRATCTIVVPFQKCGNTNFQFRTVHS